jgi:RNA polymerase sigma-70 factor, ECF subfamily
MIAMANGEWTATQSIPETDSLSFQELVESHKKNVYYLALDLTGNHHDAEDLSQEVFIKAFRAMKDFRGEAKYSSWLYRITVNTYIDETRKKSHQLVPLPEEHEGEEDIRTSAPLSDPRSNPEKDLESVNIQKHIDEALKKLTPRERSVFVLRHYNDLILKEIGEVLNISEGTVKSLLFRAIKRMQKELAFYRPGLGKEKES